MPRPDFPADAVIFHGHIGTPNEPEFRARLAALAPNDLYGPALGAKRVRFAPPAGPHPFNFGYKDGDAAQTLNFPVEHALSGQSRYAWYPARPTGEPGKWDVDAEPVDGADDHAGRVMFGWLKDEARPTMQAELRALAPPGMGGNPAGRKADDATEKPAPNPLTAPAPLTEPTLLTTPESPDRAP